MLTQFLSALLATMAQNELWPRHGQVYEIRKIWVPTHGVVNIYRNARGEYHVSNAVILERSIKRDGVEKLRILASHGVVIKITRDGSVPRLQNNYTIESSLSMDQPKAFISGVEVHHES